jgi:osmoprotectant transport system permease protein
LIAVGGLGAALQNGIQFYEMGTIPVTGIWVGLLAVLSGWDCRYDRNHF